MTYVADGQRYPQPGVKERGDKVCILTEDASKSIVGIFNNGRGRTKVFFFSVVGVLSYVLVGKHVYMVNRLT